MKTHVLIILILIVACTPNLGPGKAIADPCIAAQQVQALKVQAQTAGTACQQQRIRTECIRQQMIAKDIAALEPLAKQCQGSLPQAVPQTQPAPQTPIPAEQSRTQTAAAPSSQCATYQQEIERLKTSYADATTMCFQKRVTSACTTMKAQSAQISAYRTRIDTECAGTPQPELPFIRKTTPPAQNVPVLPNLAIDSIALNVIQVAPLQRQPTLEVTFRNIGEGDISAEFTLNAKATTPTTPPIDSSVLLNKQSVMRTGETRKQSIILNTLTTRDPFTAEVKICIDSTSQVQEVDENNNCVTKKVEVPTGCVENQGQSCGNCGGTINCDGTCSISTPATFGNSCGSCEGTIKCDGTCSVSTPSNFGASCGSCGGTVKCDGTCSVLTPSNFGASCGSCGGTVICGGTCSVPTPSNFGTSCNCNGRYDCAGNCANQYCPSGQTCQNGQCVRPLPGYCGGCGQNSECQPGGMICYYGKCIYAGQQGPGYPPQYSGNSLGAVFNKPVYNLQISYTCLSSQIPYAATITAYNGQSVVAMFGATCSRYSSYMYTTVFDGPLDRVYSTHQGVNTGQAEWSPC